MCSQFCDEDIQIFSASDRYFITPTSGLFMLPALLTIYVCIYKQCLDTKDLRNNQAPPSRHLDDNVIANFKSSLTAPVWNETPTRCPTSGFQIMQTQIPLSADASKFQVYTCSPNKRNFASDLTLLHAAHHDDAVIKSKAIDFSKISSVISLMTSTHIVLVGRGGLWWQFITILTKRFASVA